MKFRYYNYDATTGCYDIHLSNPSGIDNLLRIWVSDEQGNDRDIDTLHYHETGKRLCSKYVQIAFDASTYAFKRHDNDDSGI